MRALAGLAVVALTSAGCALPPEFIAESHVIDPYFHRMSCPELAIARANVAKEVALASTEQSRFVGVLFPSAEYERNTRRIAELKGALAAIGRAQTMAGCAAAPAGMAGEPAALPPIDAGPDDGAAAEADGMAAGEAAW